MNGEQNKKKNIAMFIYLYLGSSDIVITNSISGKVGEVGLYGEMRLAGDLSQQGDQTETLQLGFDCR
jgi:hypothetical protein